MGTCVSVQVEGEEDSPFEERTDGKHLADLVGEIYDPEFVAKMGLTPLTTGTLGRLPQEDEEAIWQDPNQLKGALEELRRALPRIRADREMQRTFAIGKHELDAVVNVYDMAVEDAIKMCEWAANRSRRAALVIW